MNIIDRITLLRAGYSRKEIDAMIEEDRKAAEQETEMLKQAAVAPAEAQKPAVSEPEEKEPEKIPSAPEPDYKAEYEKEKAVREALQEENRRRDNKGNDISDEQALKDLVSSFI